MGSHRTWQHHKIHLKLYIQQKIKFSTLARRVGFQLRYSADVNLENNTISYS